MSVAVSFSINMSGFVSVRNNLIASLSVTGLTPNSSTYFLVSIWEGSVKISESYTPGSNATTRVLLSPQLAAYCENKVVNNQLVSQDIRGYLPVIIKCSLFHTVSGVQTEYLADNIGVNLLFARVPRSVSEFGFLEFYSSFLGEKFITLSPDNDSLTKKEAKKIYFIYAKNGVSAEDVATYTSPILRIEFTYVDDTTGIVNATFLEPPSYGEIRGLQVDYAYLRLYATKEFSKVAISIVATEGVSEVTIAAPRTYVVDSRFYELQRSFCFLNSLGVFEYFSAKGMSKAVTKTKRESFVAFSDLSSPFYVNQSKTTKIASDSSREIEIGPIISKRKFAALQELLESPLVYEVFILPDGSYKYLPINVLTDKLPSFEDENYIATPSFQYEYNLSETSTLDFIN